MEISNDKMEMMEMENDRSYTKLPPDDQAKKVLNDLGSEILDRLNFLGQPKEDLPELIGEYRSLYETLKKQAII